MSIDTPKTAAKAPVNQRNRQHVAVNSLAGSSVEQHLSTAVSPLVEIGLVLRQAREERSINLQQVASQLNIFERHLRSIEAGELPAVALTFARGYLKNYANYLGLDSVFLLNSFDAHTRPAPVVDPSGAVEREVSSDSFLPRFDAMAASIKAITKVIPKVFGRDSGWGGTGYRSPLGFLNAVTSTALPLLLLCIVAFAYYSVDVERPEADIAAVAALQNPVATPEKLGPLASEAIAASRSGDAPQNNSVQPSTSVAMSDTTAIADNTVTEASTVETGSFEAVTAMNSIATPTVHSAYPAGLADQSRRERQLAGNTTSQVRAAGVITLGGATAAQSQSRSIVPGDSIEDSFEPVGPGAVEMISQMQSADRLVITVYEDSWIDVRDNSGARLYRNLARAGKRIDVSGKLPFALHVGNVPGLEMRLNGEPVEITRYRSDNSARLILASNE